MLDLLEFIFQDFVHFLGFVILWTLTCWAISEFKEEKELIKMKFAVTREDLRRMIQKEAGIDINVLTVDLEIEGYVKAKDYKLKAQLGGVGSENSYEAPHRTVTVTDGNMNVIEIRHEDEAVKKPSENVTKEEPRKKRKYMKRKRKGPKNQYVGPVDYESYEHEVMDFATSQEDKREVPAFGLTIPCIKERYKKIIRNLQLTDMVRFSQIDCRPYLVRIQMDSVNSEEPKVEKASAVSEKISTI